MNDQQFIAAIFNDKNITFVFKILALIGPLLGAAIGFWHYRPRHRPIGGLISGALWGSCTVILLGMWNLLGRISERFGAGNIKGLLLFSFLFLLVVFLWTVISTLVQQVATRPLPTPKKETLPSGE